MILSAFLYVNFEKKVIPSKDRNKYKISWNFDWFLMVYQPDFDCLMQRG